MKQIITLILLTGGLMTLSGCSGQAEKQIETNNKILQEVKQNMQVNNRYKLYETTNMYNFLKLDTKTGQIEIVQWSLDQGKEFIYGLSNEDLSLGKSCANDVFELYPTTNIYQFILLNKEDGRTWHVQWGFDEGNRWIRRKRLRDSIL